MDKIYKWGVMGAGNIAERVMSALDQVPNACLYAVASQTKDKAKRFAEANGALKWYSSYKELAEDSDVDIVYVATTNQLHMQNTLLALDNGKAVLCEKPMAVNRSQVSAMIESARKNKVFLMEAMWSRYFPITVHLRKLLDEKIIGDVRTLVGDFSYAIPGADLSDAKFRSFDPACAGGGLIDVGIYVLWLACMVFNGIPNRVSGLATMSSLNVDAHSVAVVGFEGGGIASIYSGIDADSGSDAQIYGSKGRIRIPNFWHPDTMEILVTGEKPQTVTMPFEKTGYQFELAEVQRCLDSGLLESPLMPWELSLGMTKTMDDIRALWGLKYPCE